MSDAATVVDQAEFWNGDTGRRWAENQERMDRAFAPLTTSLVERAAARQGERVIDVGCGSGVVSLELARLVGTSGRVLAIDLSRPMLERARARDAEERGAGRASIDWREADAALFPFEPGGCDLIVSRFGVMFFADPVAAFRNLRMALRPGGRMAMLCWRAMPENAWVAVPRAAMLTVVPPPPPAPADAPGPFAFADAARVGAVLAEAGFAAVRSEKVDGALDVEGGADEQAAFLAQLGPASALLKDADEATRGQAIAALVAALRERTAAGSWAPNGACWLFTAERRP